MDEPVSFGYWIRRRRKALDLTREALAQQVGCAVVTIRKIEADERRPSRQIAERLAECLVIPPADRASFLQAARAELAVDRLPTPPAPPLTPPPARPPRERPPHQQALKGYELHEQIGTGGFGAVYCAAQPGVGREVAVKIIRPEYANHPDFIRRFEAEAQVVARLEHPHIVPLYDYWRESGGAYLVMRYIRGGSLQAALRDGPWALERSTRLLDEIGAALAFAHRQGVVHRDLKPANILLDEENNAYLADFGIAKDLFTATAVGDTQPRAVIGSPAYLSPEQLKDEPITPATDIYSLGVLLYELLAGAHPFADLPPTERLYQQLHAPLPPLHERRPDIPGALNAVIQRATAKAPDERYSDVVSMVVAWQRAIAPGSAPTPTLRAEPQDDAWASDLATELAATPIAPDMGAPPGPVESAITLVPSIPNNLPLQLTGFVGRAREIAELKRLLRVSRLLTLTGAGGSGKTRLALQIAADLLAEPGEYEHGVDFVSLAPIRDPGLLISAIAQTVDVRESPGQPLEESLKAYLHDKHLLLLLDNFEQIVEAAPQVVELLKAAPDLKVLVTSRAALQVSGEQRYPLQPLALPDLGKLPELEALSEVEAVSLFVQRATNVKPHFTLTKENCQAIAEICHRLDGLPLAIELAAARLNVLTPQVLLEKLSSSLTLLTSGARDRPARHQTLRAAIEWSYSLLDNGEQKLFRRMAVFVGGGTLEATAAVCNAEGDMEMDVLDGVASLLDKSLLRPEEGVRGEPRFWTLETIHEYAREKLQKSGEAEALHKEHARYFMRLAEAAEPHLTGKQHQAWLEGLEVEHDNFRVALRWAVASGEAGSAQAGTAPTSNEAQTGKAPTARERATTGNPAALELEIGLRTAGALRQFWDVRGYYREGSEELQRLLSAADRLGCPRAVRLKALNAAGVLTYRQGAYAAARSTLEQALAVGRELGDRQSMALSLHHLGNAAFGQGDYAAARSLYQESLALRRDLGDTWGIAICLNNLGSVAYLQGDDAAARSLYEESLALFREEGDKWGIAVPLLDLGNVACLQGDYAAARSLCEEGLVTSKEIGSKHNIAIGIAALGGIAAATGQPQRGARLLGAADALLQGIGSVLETENRRPYAAGVASARAQLGEAEFEKAMQQGRSLLMEQAIAYALDPTLLPTNETPGLAPAPAPSPAPGPGTGRGTRPRYPEGLTRREVEVLRLVAQGLTNAEIAARLFLSPNTVNVHLYSIFGKLGVTTRTAAARFAVEHKLV